MAAKTDTDAALAKTAADSTGPVEKTPTAESKAYVITTTGTEHVAASATKTLLKAAQERSKFTSDHPPCIPQCWNPARPTGRHDEQETPPLLLLPDNPHGQPSLSPWSTLGHWDPWLRPRN